jgi:outer membrane protein assembly factor BamA
VGVVVRAMVGVVFLVWAAPALGQRAQTGLGWSVLPGIGYDSDEGLGYSADVGLYQYGDGSLMPYRWALESSVYVTSKGRVSVTAFYDVPRAFGERVRVAVRANLDRDCCQPFYGLGDASVYDPALSGRYYTYRRNRVTGALNVQVVLLPGLRLLTGIAADRGVSAARDTVTLFGQSVVGETRTSVGPKLGLAYDTRDLERDPRRGVWLEAIAWQGVVLDGGEFTRVTATLRGYASPVPWLTLAARVFGEQVRGDMPLSLLADLGSSFQDFTGVGGAESIRGVLRQRFLGRTRMLTNTEIRLRGPGFRLFGAPWQLGGVGFLDAGRVWDDRGLGDGSAGLHWGKGAGLRIAWGASFIIGADIGYGREAGLQTYLRLGHLF